MLLLFWSINKRIFVSLLIWYQSNLLFPPENPRSKISSIKSLWISPKIFFNFFTKPPLQLVGLPDSQRVKTKPPSRQLSRRSISLVSIYSTTALSNCASPLLKPCQHLLPGCPTLISISMTLLQPRPSLLSKAKFLVMADTYVELEGSCRLLRDMSVVVPLHILYIMICDNKSVISFVTNIVFHERTEHAEVDSICYVGRLLFSIFPLKSKWLMFSPRLNLFLSLFFSNSWSLIHDFERGY